MRRTRGITAAPPSRTGGLSLLTAARLWGAFAGIGGLVHGIGEVIQGNVTTPGLFISSWTTGPIADNLGGEPGLTIVPNLLVTGLLTVALASVLIVLSLRRAGGQSYGWVLIGLSAGMLLVGGGVGPPVIGLCAGAAALAGRRSWTSRRAGVRSALWPWLYWLSLAVTAFLVFGSLFAAFVLDVDVSTAFVYAFFTSLALLPATIVAGRASRKGSSP